jgi:hypothetical protein
MWMRRPTARPRRNPTNDIKAVMAAKIVAASTGETPSNPKLVPAIRLSRFCARLCYVPDDAKSPLARCDRVEIGNITVRVSRAS